MVCLESEDTIKIMLATDNHIGYNERDPIRGQDSINTFKEILQLAVKYDVSLWSEFTWAKDKSTVIIVRWISCF